MGDFSDPILGNPSVFGRLQVGLSEYTVLEDAKVQFSR